MKRCEEVVPLLGPLHDAALADDDRAWVEDHVRGCPSCQDRLKLIGAQAQALRSVIEARGSELDLSGLADRVMARVGQERPGFSQPAPVWGREMWWAHRGALAAGGALALAACIAAAIPAGTDPKLKPIGPQLESFGEQFRFRSYRLIDERSFDLYWKNAAEVELPGSRSLQVTPRQLDADGKIKVHLELLGEHPAHTRKLHTDYAIQRGGTILVGGIRVDPRDEKAGKLLIAITQEVEK